MFKQSPSRNQRSKGFKAKHALQIGLLLAVCFWLLYQVKHSHDKKKAFDESNAVISEKMEMENEMLKLGRKDLHPRVEESISENEQHNEEEEIEEEEDENKHGREEEEMKHEDLEEEDGEENKHDEIEDEVKGDGDDETEEHDREIAEEEANREVALVDEEEKEREEREKEDQIDEQDHDKNTQEKQEEEREKEHQIEDQQDQDRNTQEAREEQYNGDDASSAVVRGTQLLNKETENGFVEKTEEEGHVETLEAGELGLQNKTNTTEEVTNVKAGDGEIAEGNPTLNATDLEKRGSGIMLSESEDGSQPNSTANVESNGQQEVNNNSTAEYGGNLSEFMQNGTDITQNQTVVMTPSRVSDSNLQTAVPDQTENSNTANDTMLTDSNSVPYTVAVNSNASNAESAEEHTVKSESTTGEVVNPLTSVINDEITGNQKNETETTTGTEEAEEKSSVNDNVDSGEVNSVDPNDALIPEIRDVATDLGTLPESMTEGTNSEDASEK